MRISVAFACLLVGCGAGDLTLPESSQPVVLSIVSGDGQRADAGTLLDRPLIVRVLDDSSNPVEGASVEFSFLGEVPGAGIDPGVVATGEDGTAEAVVRLGTISGPQMIVARVVGAATPELTARFLVTAVDARGGGDGDGDDGGPGKGHGKGHGGAEDEDD
ncbi:MAG TPA: hypothetical protein VH764_18575 [Gemmatimonadales bacterium]|jgi:hypothetical protein